LYKVFSKKFRNDEKFISKGLQQDLLPPNLFHRILSCSEIIAPSEQIIAECLLQYLDVNKTISPDNLNLLLSSIRYYCLPVPTLIQFSIYLSHLPPDYSSVLAIKLSNINNIPLSDSMNALLTTPLFKRRYSPLLEPLTFTSTKPYLLYTTDSDDRAVVSKKDGSWWMNIVSDQKIESNQKIYYHLNNVGGGYVGLGFGCKSYEAEENFLGQRPDGWCLVTSRGYDWDGNIYNGITSNTGIAYAPPNGLYEGTTIILEINVDDGKAHWIVNDQVLPTAWQNFKGKEIYVIVSMFLPGSNVTVWREKI